MDNAVNDNQKKVWNEIAGKWNKFRNRISPTVEDFVSKQRGEILDLGCGSGRNFLWVDGLSWHAVDFSGEMIKFAEAKAKEIGIDLDAKVAESSDLPFEDNFFDSVLCFAVLHCVESEEKRRRTLEEIYRVLRVGGVALISVWGKNAPRVKNKGKEFFVPWSAREGEGKQMRYTYIFDLDELVGLCEDVGFRVERAWEERNVNLIVRK